MLLRNGGFEGKYTARGAPEVRIAPEWEPFWLEGMPHEGQGPAMRPEFKPVTTAIDRLRIVDGDTAQGWFVRWKTMDAGVYQRVTGLQAGQELTFSASVQVWCSQKDNPRADDGELYMRVGIDPTGSVDPWADSVQWSGWKPGTKEHKRISVTATAAGDAATVFVRGWNKWKLSHNDAYVDAAELIVEGGEPEEPAEPVEPVEPTEPGEPTEPSEWPSGDVAEQLAAISAKLDKLDGIAAALERIATLLDKSNG